MFGLLFAPQPTAEPIVPVSPVVPDEAYRDLAEMLGVQHVYRQASHLQDRQRFESFLATQGILVYNRKAVVRYLNRQYGFTPWGFRALREQDNPSMGGNRERGNFIASDGTFNDGQRRWRRKNNGSLIGNRDRSLYQKPVPYPVLLTVHTVSKAFPYATFWVSDEATRQPTMKDPFLMVRFNDDAEYIIERWDEPSFRG